MEVTFYLTGVDLSKILSVQTKILKGAKGGKSDKCMGVSQLLGDHARARAGYPFKISRTKCHGKNVAIKMSRTKMSFNDIVWTMSRT